MRILLIEDDRKISQNIKEFLEQNTYSVDISNDGIEGFSLAKNSVQYDILILDVMLPNKDGVSICKDLRSLGIKTPIIMLTAKDALEAKIEGLDAGADDYLIKPFSLRELLARINAQIRRSYNNLDDGTILKIDNLTLDTKTKKVLRGGVEILLTKKLYQLLELLIRNQGKVLSKGEIEEHIWDMNAELWSDVVRSHIQILRSKIDRNYEKKLIKTVHGMGYTINEN